MAYGQTNKPNPKVAQIAKNISITRWCVILLAISGIILFLFAKGIADYVVAIESHLFLILLALWRMEIVQDLNASRIVELLEEQNKLLRSDSPATADGSAQVNHPRTTSPFDRKTSDGRFVI